jgi:hypothetical protein
MVKNMSKKWKVIIYISFLLLVLATGFTIFKMWKEREEIEKGIPSPYLPKEGEKVDLLILAYYEGGIPAGSVNITFTKNEILLSQLTDENGTVKFPVIVGHDYTITATLGNSSRSMIYKIKPYEFIVVTISRDNIVKSIEVYQAGIP